MLNFFREFEKVARNECALCGEATDLTGEHKIKASIIRSEFGSEKTVIFGKKPLKLMQSPKSKHLHFDTRICHHCNSTATQPADVAFDKLHRGLKQNLSSGAPLTDDCGSPNIYLVDKMLDDSFRYFAKLLNLFLVEVGGPRSRSISSFAIGSSNRNPVCLKISEDVDYLPTLEAFGTKGFANHGGLQFMFDADKHIVQSFLSSLSIGGIRYEFWASLKPHLTVELDRDYPDLMAFARSCANDLIT